MLTGCGNSETAGTAMVDEICRQLGADLPTRSVDDTQQTRDEITDQYATFALVCPGWEELIPS
jgi:hypothetical protein